MPHIKIARKSTATDMTPFVDIAFLILSFFIMATKFKPDEPIKVTTPNSVSSMILEENNALLITIDKQNKVYININSKDKTQQGDVLDRVIQGLNASRNLGLSPAQMANFKSVPIVGVPFAQLKNFLDMPTSQQGAVSQPGIPVLDSTNNELVWWVSETKKAFAGQKLIYMIKGDNDSKYPTFEGVINALRKNEEFKYDLITAQEGAPVGTELYQERLEGRSKK